ncbi:MAG: hypothetical protein VB046_08535 [Paludibacter sp.]|nr:hypothetical protein [Paludibacter sp.]
MKSEFIGSGAHWNVERIYFNENGILKTVIHKKAKSLNRLDIDDNLAKYDLIARNELPTLSMFLFHNSEVSDFIIAEDLNPPQSDGLYVSPNTVRNASSYASLIVDYLNPNKELSIEKLEKFNLIKYLKDPKKLSNLNDEKILDGAEKEIYTNKIETISNLKEFWANSMNDMINASKNRIEIFSDAFFFRVRKSNNEVEYKIADFDNIQSHHDSEMSMEDLINLNMSHFETSFGEFIEFFVVHQKQEILRYEIKTCGNTLYK